MSKKGNVRTEKLSKNMKFTPLFDFVLEKGVSVDAARLYGWMYRNQKTWKFTIMGAVKILNYSKGKIVRLMRELINAELVDRKFISVIPREYEYTLRKSNIDTYNESESPTLEPIENTTKVQSCELPFYESSISESSKGGTVNHTNLNQSNSNQTKKNHQAVYDKFIECSSYVNPKRMQPPSKWSETRKGIINARIDEFGLEEILVILETDFKNGEWIQNTWKPPFDDIFSPVRFAKLAQGGYKDREKKEELFFGTGRSQNDK